LDYLMREVSNEDLARGYVAVVVNSNYSRGEGVLSVSTSPKQLLASYVSFPNLFRAFLRRFRVTIIDDRRGLRRLRVWIGARLLKVPGLRLLVNRAP